MTPEPPPSTLREVADYLKEFKTKLSIFSVFFLDRDKNSTKTLLKLGISGDNRRACLDELEPTDYVQGPLPNQQPSEAPLWVFGRTIRHREIYIKMTLGRPNNSVLCISFHLAEHSLQYPFKQPNISASSNS
ncbi:hypothetical protein [Hymenobacter siberiensis]|uniref:hypothetical protein n=1 Tax=Hymenobacter siberiensis TaxID=2848396 RepID=UPI001C1E6978|nr:hypothetical protein [Hymenobacter siberiensis]MBU6122611.1 hypothetical protein [Hymenobacter siberiensis]